MTSPARPYIVGLGGTNRENSSTERVLRVALDAAAAGGAEVDIICGVGLELPIYSQNVAERTPAALRLVEQLRRCDGLVLASPGYHGSLSGLVKNALDYAEDLRTDVRPYFSGRAVGCIATAGGWSAAVNTLGALRDIVHALRGWPTPMGVAINSAEQVFDDDGTCQVVRVAQMLELMAGEVMRFARPA